jgi:metallo-beta-lactamase family protein
MDSQSQTKEVKITFYGGTEGVTGANFLLESEVNGKPLRILVDCGLFQGTSKDERMNFEPFPYDPATIDAVFVTHAHMDHIGRLPLLAKHGYAGPIYSTPPTKEISLVAFQDTISLMEHEIHFGNGKNGDSHKNKKERPLLYTEKEVDLVMNQWETFGYHEPIKVGDWSVVFRDSGHILGSAMVEFTFGSKKILFTGDLGNSPAPLLKDTEVVTDVDYLIMESVYGDRNHENREVRRDKLEDIIEETMRKNGVLLIPAFSIERTQELLYEIENMMENSRIPLVPVFLDSPMAIKVTEIYKKYGDYLNTEANSIIKSGDGIFRFAQFHETMSTEDSKAIDQSNTRKIIMAGSGMSNGGRIVHHEKKYLPDAKNTILLAGYQSVGSLGRLIQDGTRVIKIIGEDVPINAKVISISGYSAHKDSDGLFNFVHQTADRVKKVFVVMGEPKSSLFLVQRLRDYLGLDAVVPKYKETVEIQL